MRKEPEALGVIGGQLRGKHRVGLMGGEGKQEETDDDEHAGSEGGKTSQRETWSGCRGMLAGQRFTAAAKTRRQRSVAQRTRLFAQHTAGALLMDGRGPTGRTAVKVPLEVGLFSRRQLAVDIGG